MSSFIVVVVVVFAMPSSTRTTLGPTPTSKPFCVVQLLERLGVHEDHRVAVLLAARLQPERSAGRLVIGNGASALQQGAFAILPADPEAGLRDLGKHEDGMRLRPELLRQRCAGVQLLQGRLRLACELGGRGLALVLGK